MPEIQPVISPVSPIVVPPIAKPADIIQPVAPPITAPTPAPNPPTPPNPASSSQKKPAIKKTATPPAKPPTDLQKELMKRNGGTLPRTDSTKINGISEEARQANYELAKNVGRAMDDDDDEGGSNSGEDEGSNNSPAGPSSSTASPRPTPPPRASARDRAERQSNQTTTTAKSKGGRPRMAEEDTSKGIMLRLLDLRPKLSDAQLMSLGMPFPATQNGFKNGGWKKEKREELLNKVLMIMSEKKTVKINGATVPRDEVPSLRKKDEARTEKRRQAQAKAEAQEESEGEPDSETEPEPTPAEKAKIEKEADMILDFLFSGLWVSALILENVLASYRKTFDLRGFSAEIRLPENEAMLKPAIKKLYTEDGRFRTFIKDKVGPMVQFGFLLGGIAITVAKRNKDHPPPDDPPATGPPPRTEGQIPATAPQ